MFFLMMYKREKVNRVYLFARRVRALPGASIVHCAVERDVSVTPALLIVHLIALLNLNPVHFDGAARLRRHHNLVCYDLPEESQQRRPVLRRAETVLTPHKQPAEFARRGSIRSSHAVDSI